MQGIYVITNRASGKVYVGSSVNVGVRWRSHRAALRRGDHVNAHLQAAWLKHGVDAFAFEVVEEVLDAQHLVVREQAWLDALQSCNPAHGYNLSPTAGNTLGFRFSPEQRAALKGRPRSQEHRANLWANRTVTPEHRAQMAGVGRRTAGVAKSDEHRRRIGLRQRGSANHAAKLTEAVVAAIRERLAGGERGRHLATECGISESIVSEIKTGKRWRHVGAAA